MLFADTLNSWKSGGVHLKEKRFDSEFKKDNEKGISVGRTRVQLIMHQQRYFATGGQAGVSFKYWFDYYNTRRRHSALSGIYPLMYEIRR